MSGDSENQQLIQNNHSHVKEESMFGQAKSAFTTYYSNFLGELVGSFCFALGITASTTSDDMGDAFVAFSLFFGILMVLPWSGGHLNNAVSAGFYQSDIDFGFDKLWVYFAGQLSGAYFGALAGTIIVGVTAAPTMKNTEFAYVMWAILIEAIATFTFVFIIHLAAHKSNVLNELYKVATIAFGLFFARYIAVATSGAALNPTIAWGLQLNKSIWEGSAECWTGWYVYTIGTYLGGSLAGFWFRRIYNPYFDPENDAREQRYAERKEAERKQRQEKREKEEEEKRQQAAKNEEAAKQQQQSQQQSQSQPQSEQKSDQQQ